MTTPKTRNKTTTEIADKWNNMPDSLCKYVEGLAKIDKISIFDEVIKIVDEHFNAYAKELKEATPIRESLRDVANRICSGAELCLNAPEHRVSGHCKSKAQAPCGYCNKCCGHGKGVCASYRKDKKR